MVASCVWMLLYWVRTETMNSLYLIPIAFRSHEQETGARERFIYGDTDTCDQSCPNCLSFLSFMSNRLSPPAHTNHILNVPGTCSVMVILAIMGIPGYFYPISCRVPQSVIEFHIRSSPTVGLLGTWLFFFNMRGGCFFPPGCLDTLSYYSLR